MTVKLYTIIHAIDHLRPTLPYTASIIDHMGFFNKAQQLFQDELAMMTRNTYAASLYTNQATVAVVAQYR